MNPLTDPNLSGARREPRSADELCAIAHDRHMKEIDQDGWLADLMATADERKKADEERLEADCATFRETRRWPTEPGAEPKSPKKKPAKGN